MFVSNFIRLAARPAVWGTTSRAALSTTTPLPVRDGRHASLREYLNKISVRDLIEDRGSRVIQTVPSTATVKEAVEVMSKTNIGAILVEEQKDPVGIFTERDYLMKIAAKELNPANVKISDVMTSDLFTGSPDLSLLDAVGMLADHGIRHLPIATFVGDPADGDSRIIDIVSARDFFTWFK